MASVSDVLSVAMIRHPIILSASTSAQAAIARLIAPETGSSSNPDQNSPQPTANESPHCLYRAYTIAQQERSRYLLVVDETVEPETQQNRLIGIVNLQALITSLIQPETVDDRTVGDRTLRDLMSPIIATQHEDDCKTLADLDHLHQVMQKQGIDCVPLLNAQDQPVGFISHTSLLCALQTHETVPVAQASESKPSETPHTETSSSPSASSPSAATIAQWRDQAVRYRALFEDAHDAIILANLEGYITEVNYQAEVMFGYSRQEFLGMHQSELHPPEDVESVVAKFQAVLQENVHTGKDVRIVCKDKKIKYTDIRGKMIVADNTPVIQGIFHDITQRKRTEDTLRILIEGTESKQGDEFFFSLVKTIAIALNVNHVFLTERNQDTLQTLAIYSDNQFQKNITYRLENTPCEQVIQIGHFSCETDLKTHFPQAPILLGIEAESYIGSALFNQAGHVIGHLFIQDEEEINDSQQLLSILAIFASRAAAEIERQHSRERLEKLNQELQDKLKNQGVELQEKEHFLQTLLDLDAFPLSVFWKDLNSVYLGCNRAFLRDANLSSMDEIVGKSDYEMPWAETEADAYRADDREVMENNQAKLGIIETQVQADGKQVWVETNKIPFQDLEGNVIGVLGLYQDITERRRTENELQQVSMRLNLAIRSAQIGIWDWDIVNNALVWDEQMFALYGIEDDLAHEAYEVWLSCVHPDDTERANHAIEQALAGEKDYDLEFRIVRPNGDIHFIQATAIVQRNSEGQPIRMIGTNYDTTDRKRNEALLQQQLETIEAAAEGIGILREERYISINTAHLRLFGYEQADELLGKSWRLLYEADELRRFDHEIIPRLMDDRTWQGEAIARRKDGSTFDQGLSLTLSENGDLICMCRDISKRKQAEQQLRVAKEAAEFADRAKSHFLALMSHEIRTPINGVLGLAHLMQQTSLDSQQQEYLDKLQHSAASLSTIVNDILDFSKMEADQLSLNLVEFELDEILERLQAVLALKAEEKQLELRFEVGDTVPRRLIGDPLRLGQVAINLVSNSIKFTDRGHVIVSIEELDRHPSEYTTHLRFAVHDTGIGLTAEQIKLLFQPFTQVDPSASRRQSGTGLGLAICQKLIFLMGGRINVDSDLGRGSTFRFDLALQYCTHDHASADYEIFDTTAHDISHHMALNSSQPSSHPSSPTHDPDILEPRPFCQRVQLIEAHERAAPKLTIPSSSVTPRSVIPSTLPEALVLVVEDNDVNQLVAQKVLEQFGLQVEIAANGRQAIAQVLHQRYDLILMDVRMPEMDGLEATRRIRRLAQLGTQQTQYLDQIPIIAMTAHAFESDRQRSLEAGMNDHLSKPINPEILSATLTHWLNFNRDPSPSRSPSSLPPPPSASISSIATPSITTTHPETTIALPIDDSSHSSHYSALDPESPALPFPGLSLSAGLERVYGEAQLYCELLQLFVEIYEPFASNLAMAFQQPEPDEITLLVHTLKGAAANVAASTVVEHCDPVLLKLRGLEHDRQTLQFESTEIVLLLRSLDEALASMVLAIEALRAETDTE